MRKRALADVLWEAANRRLCPVGTLFTFAPTSVETYSCCAIARVINPGTDYLPLPVERWIDGLGCDTTTSGFNDFDDRAQRQGVRYMWLLLAMHVAEDENIMVSA